MSAHFIVLFQVLQLLSLKTSLIKHIWVEERANFLVVTLQTFKDKQRRDYEEDLGLPTLELLRKLFVLFAGGFDYR